MILLAITGLYLFWFLVPTSEGALVQTDISGQLAAANGNRTTLNTQIAHGLAAGPAYRGTFDIAWSCLLTILACIYNAIHLNVPPRNTGKWMRLLRKVKWATIALFAPEIVLYTATTQFLEAHKVKEKVNAMRGQIRGKNKPKLIDLRYGFYVTMGGFVYDVENLCDDLRLVTLTPRGIIALAREGQFVDISTEDIKDKSKADIFTKGLICIQVSWMVIQCIARKAAGYPLTLLEIHTMVHVVCALTIYMLWLKKPYDIIEPTVIYAANYASYAATVAFMLMVSDIINIDEALSLSLNIQASLDYNLDKLAVNGQEIPIADKNEKRIKVLGEAGSFLGSSYSYSRSRKVSISPESTVCTLQPGQYLPCGIGVQAQSPTRYDLTWSDIRRWELFASAIVEILKSSPRERYNLADTVKIQDLDFFLMKRHDLYETLLESIPNFPKEMLRTLSWHLDENDTPLRDTVALFLYLLRFFIPLTSAYGGIHLSAWNFNFPSRIESFLWRTACFVLMGSPFTLLAVPNGVRIYWMSSQFVLRALIKGVGWGYVGLLILCYVASRLYLVVESFISLRHVPIGVYAAVPWVQNIPHV